ncbi:hypothetical protein BCR37DRAFT_192888 [Protomyces lactucae-debilis]|uniref:Uncharacterized protein n=1 Tax=Protomyces lactucae-debilis TaxID=2754530 RepID=A0A1Y2EW74_PROLT|nr:uncharacterized protein BCR37DRAFT_192888 [Protomyces lactucae-debilis]ORY75075.1 hypothetical protein BCR37DRAFT_192888 [Protomyces lactucae-debilis]
MEGPTTEQRPSMHTRKRSSICIGRPDRRPASIRIPSSGSASSTSSSYAPVRSAEPLSAGALMPLRLEAAADPIHPASKHRRTLSLATTAERLPLQLALQPCREQAEEAMVRVPTRRARPTSIFFSRFTSIAQPAEPVVTPPAVQTGEQQREMMMLRGQVEDLSTRVMAKDMTISMLSERVDDLSMEMELMRSKMRLLEHALSNTPSSARLDDTLLTSAEEDVACLGLAYSAQPWQDQDKQRPSLSARSISTSGDSAMGQSIKQESNFAHQVSPTLSRQSSASAYSTPASTRTQKYTGDVSPGDVSMSVLQLENEALKLEVKRLQSALEEGLGALADLAL